MPVPEGALNEVEVAGFLVQAGSEGVAEGMD
jgi:hypothetical protein